MNLFAHPQVRAAAVRDLGQVHGHTSLPLLVPLLSDKSDEVRMAALNAVAQADVPSVLGQIRPLVNDSSELERRITTRMVETFKSRLGHGREGGLGQGSKWVSLFPTPQLAGGGRVGARFGSPTSLRGGRASAQESRARRTSSRFTGASR